MLDLQASRAEFTAQNSSHKEIHACVHTDNSRVGILNSMASQANLASSRPMRNTVPKQRGERSLRSDSQGYLWSPHRCTHVHVSTHVHTQNIWLDHVSLFVFNRPLQALRIILILICYI